MKIVLNKCYGGFELSNEAERLYIIRKGVTNEKFSQGDIERNDPVLVRIVEEMKGLANGPYSHLEVFEIPDGVSFTVDEYDGMETCYIGCTETV